VVLESYADNRDLGGVILIDRLTNHTVAAGLVHVALRRADNVHPQALDVHKRVRSSQKGQRAGVVWLTGLSGAGKSTIANHAEEMVAAGAPHLPARRRQRRGLNRDLGYRARPRGEHPARGRVARLAMVDAGLIVLVAFISPFRDERSTARGAVRAGRVRRGLCGHADRGGRGARSRRVCTESPVGARLKNFTGIDSPMSLPSRRDPPRHDRLTAEAAADRILAYLAGAGFSGR
jgi:bifunctional enzyme CysN/CysC